MKLGSYNYRRQEIEGDERDGKYENADSFGDGIHEICAFQLTEACETEARFAATFSVTSAVASAESQPARLR